MAELKTKKTRANVKSFLATVDDTRKRADCEAVAKMMRQATGSSAKMWGSGIVGFGSYDYRYESGRTGTWMLCGFSPRKQNLVIYIMSGFSGYPGLMKKLGKVRTGKSCLYIRRLDDVDRDVLEALIGKSVDYMKTKYTTAKGSGK